MRFNLKIAVVIVIAILLISSGYYIFFINEESKDTEAPIIDVIPGNISAKQGESIDISVTFSDNKNVTSAIIYYKTENSDTWSNSSILSGTFNLYIPKNTSEDWYYYIVIDDAAGNGPIGDPSIDGSIYYTITVTEGGNGGDEDFVHTVFVEESTATDCKNCPYASDKLEELYNSGEYRFYYVSLVADENDVANDRVKNDYNLYGNPTVFIDGGYNIINGGSASLSDYITAIGSAESRSVPKIKINVTSEYDNSTDKITTNILINNYEESDYSGRLRVYLTEKISRWNDYNGSKYHFGFLDYIVNKDVSIDKNSEEEYTDSYDATDLDPANLMIIAVLFSSEFHQAYAYPPDVNPFDAHYADACDATEVIKGGNLPPEVGITFPQPGQVYRRGNPAFKIITSGINLLRNTTILKYTWLFGKTTITAYAEDDSSVEKVEFYINGELIFNDTEEPYEFGPQKMFFKKPLVIPKKYEIMVKAYDDEGKSSTAAIEVIAWRAFIY